MKVDDIKRICNGVLNGLLTPNNASRLMCSTYVCSKGDSLSMEASEEVFYRLLNQRYVLSQAIERLQLIWEK